MYLNLLFSLTLCCSLSLYAVPDSEDAAEVQTTAPVQTATADPKTVAVTVTVTSNNSCLYYAWPGESSPVFTSPERTVSPSHSSDFLRDFWSCRGY